MFITAVVTTAMLFAFLPPRVAYAATYVVNSTADTTQCDGNTCTLRGALIQAGLSAGVDTITFSIGTGGGITPPVIQPASQLPSIQDGVVIDGTTQSQGQVVIDGSLAGAGANGFVQIAASGSTFRGLVIQNFSGNGIVLGTGGGNLVAGNIIGLDYTGKISRPNGGDGIALSNSAKNTIGGPQLADRNLISANAGFGIHVLGSSDGTLIQNNYVGLDYSGGAGHGNAKDGIALESAYNVVKDNVVSANQAFGIEIFGGSNNSVYNNKVGTNAAGTTALANNYGVVVTGGSANAIGVLDVGGNLVSGNSNDGIWIRPSTPGVSIAENLVGTDLAGKASIANGGHGIFVSGDGTSVRSNTSRYNVLGGIGFSANNLTVKSNVLSGNRWGLFGSGNNGTFQDNIIDANQIDGVFIGFPDSTNVSNSFTGNTIRNNGGAGIFLRGGQTNETIDRNLVSAGSITNNVGKGIDLSTGANDGIAAPAVTAVTFPNGGLLVQGTGAVGANVQIYADPQDEGAMYLASVGMDATGHWQNSTWGPNTDVTAIVTALKAGALFITATQTDDLNNTSQFSAPKGPGAGLPNHQNHTWVSALLLTDGVGIDDGIGKANQSTWYRIPIGPQMHVKVDLTNLGANESLTLYRDIRMVARAMRQHANTLAQIRQNTSGNISADDIDSDDIDSDDIDSDDIDSGTLVADDIDSDDIDSDDIDSDDIDSDDIDSDDIDSDDIDSNGNGDTGFGPVYSSAERKALRALSANQGLAPESITFNTRDLTGDLYIRVRGHHGAFNAQQPFHVVATRLPDVSCAGVAKNLLVARAPSTDPLSFPTNAHTLILTNSAAFPAATTAAQKAALLTALNGLAANGNVQGVVVDLAGDANAQLGMADLRTPEGQLCVAQANIVSDTIGQLVASFRARNPMAEYLVVAGGDRVVPYRRVPDTAEISRESHYSPPVDGASQSDASLAGDYFLSDDFYATGGPVQIFGTSLSVPDLAVGRLVESAADITAYVNAFLAPGGSHADFNYDLAQYISARLGDKLGPAKVNSALQSAPGAPTLWSALDWRSAVLGADRFGILSLQGHFRANRLVPADDGQRVLSTEISTLTDGRFQKSLIYSIGCHSGYNIQDPDATPLTQPISFPEAFLEQGATLVGGTGFQYGETVLMKNTEALLARLTLELGYSNDASHVAYSNGVPIGKALVNAKRGYVGELKSVRGIDVKVVGISELYGLPFMTFTLPNASPRPTATPVTLTPLGGGLSVFETTQPFPASDLLRDDTGGVSYYYFRDRTGTSADPYRPIAPRQTTDVSSGSALPRGVVFLGGSYSETPFTPRLSVPATEETGGTPSYLNHAFTPTRPVALNQLSGDTLVTTPFQYLSNASGTGGSARVFGSVHSRLYYSDKTGASALADAPLLQNVMVSQDPGTGHLVVSAVASYDADPGISDVWLSYTDAAAATRLWQSIPMHGGTPTVRETVNGLATGYLAAFTADVAPGSDPFAMRFMIQAVGGAALVRVASNNGLLYRLEAATQAPPTTSTSLFVSAPATATYRGTLTVTAKLSTAAGALAGKTVDFKFGGTQKSALTALVGTDAISTATFNVTQAPREVPYDVSASFAGDDSALGSGDSAEVMVKPALTSITPQTPSGLQYSDNAVIGTLKTTGGVTLNDQPVEIVVHPAAGADLPPLATQTDFAGRIVLDTLDFGGLPPGHYGLRIDYPGDARYFSSTATLEFDVAIETTTVGLTELGPKPVGPITLKATIQDLPLDGAAGDYSLARIDYTFTPDVGAPFVRTATVLKDGTSSLTLSDADGTQLAAGLYRIDARLVSDYFSAAVATEVLPVSDPSTFVTGGGWVLTTATGSSGVPTGKKTNFGFNVKYKPNTMDPIGSLNLVLKETGIDLKATSFSWLVISGNRAEFEGLASSGATTGLHFRVIVYDNGSGATDTFEIRVWDATHSFDSPSYRIANTLGGGNIQVH